MSTVRHRASTPKEQLRILLDRGLTIKNPSRAKRLLKEVNYYSLIGGYQTPFLQQRKKKKQKMRYKKGATLTEIWALHELDGELKMTIFPALLRFEKLFESACAYHFSNSYKAETSPYLEPDHYFIPKQEGDEKAAQEERVKGMTKQLESTIKYYANRKPPIRYYVEKGEAIPLEVLMNFLPFGDTRDFYSNLEKAMQNEILNDFKGRFKSDYNPENIDQMTPDDFMEIVELAKFFRDICAHDEVLYSASLNQIQQREDGFTNSRHCRRFFPDKKNYTGENLHDLILVLRLVLGRRDYDLLTRKLQSVRSRYQKQFKSISIDNILAIAGWPA